MYAYERTELDYEGFRTEPDYEDFVQSDDILHDTYPNLSDIAERKIIKRYLRG